MSLDVDLTPLLSAEERRRLQALRAKFSEGRDYFAERELARLRFWRWLRSREHAPRD